MGTLRFILALSVLIFHSTPIFGCTLIGGDVRMRSFFIISGFYMSMVLNEKYVQKKGSYKLFITSRILRIYPLYWIILIISFSFYLLSSLSERSAGTLQLYYNQMEAGAMHISTLIYFIFTNIFIIGQDLILLFTIDNNTGMLTWVTHSTQTPHKMWLFLLAPQAWSMSVELLFYLIAPFILRKKIHIVFIVFLMSLLLRLYFHFTDIRYGPWEDRFFLTELAFFLAGRFSYDLYKKYANHKYSQIILVSFSIILFIYTIGFAYIPTDKIKIYFYYFIVIITIPFLFTATKNNRYDRYLGELAYPVYISHLFLLFIVNATIFPKIESVGTSLAIITIIFSFFLYEFFGRPIEKLRSRYLAKAREETP